MTILLVDDDPTYRNLLLEVLTVEGYDVCAVKNGEEALHKLPVLLPDIIVADINMPVIDGPQLHHLVRSNPVYATLPFLFISGYSDAFTLISADSRYDGFSLKGRPLHEIKKWIEYLTTPSYKLNNSLSGASVSTKFS